MFISSRPQCVNSTERIECKGAPNNNPMHSMYILWMYKIDDNSWYPHFQTESYWPPFSRRNFQICFLVWPSCILIWISLKFVTRCLINNDKPASVKIVSCRRTDDRPLNTMRPRKMDAISLTTFSNAFSWMKMFEFRLKFHWSLFPRVELTIFQHWFR